MIYKKVTFNLLKCCIMIKKGDAIKKYSLEIRKEYPFLWEQESKEFITDLYEFLEGYFFEEELMLLGDES
jgi:hypothetical protein